jgi:mRNA-degrading endonuclease RelE of RelBE toxin-antitoxin system
MYAIELTKKASDYLRSVEQSEAERILKKLYSLRENPIPHLKKLKDTRLWRLRAGPHRAIIDVLIKGKRLIVLRIGRRKNVYDR